MATSVLHVPVVVTGSAGTATGTAYTSRPVSGEIRGIYVKYNTNAASTVVVVASGNVTPGYPAETFLTLTTKNTDGWFYPMKTSTGTTGVAITYDGVHNIVDRFMVDDFISVTVTLANAVNIDVYLQIGYDT
jgi:hypothetical protein